MHQQIRFATLTGLTVHRTTQNINYYDVLTHFAKELDERLGCLLSSSYEYPNRYKRWDIGLIDPMIIIESKKLAMSLTALNKRGEVILKIILKKLKKHAFIKISKESTHRIELSLTQEENKTFTEEQRSKQTSVFSVIRIIQSIFYNKSDQDLGLYGSFGYDLAFQFEHIQQNIPRNELQRDMVLFIPDKLLIRDHTRKEAKYYYYDFIVDGIDTQTFSRAPTKAHYHPYQCTPESSTQDDEVQCDHAPKEYEQTIRTAKKAFKRGDLFEVVPSQTFSIPSPKKPSEIFSTLRISNPSPYGFMMNLGDQEFLIGASPEMFVRVTDKEVETCPISGTIARGVDAIGDAKQIRKLLNSEKDLNELTMCTDVDRNDKSRICEPGSVQVIGRRQIELYSKLIHTVDHVRGNLRDSFDALDAFLTHAWAVTVTGAPKKQAMQFIEKHEKSARNWYGGAIGRITFDGNINTGLTLRTVHIRDSIASIRSGATVLWDSIPEAEEEETRLKAEAMMQAISGESLLNQQSSSSSSKTVEAPDSKAQQNVLLIDYNDSFVNTLSDYFRQTGANVVTIRYNNLKDISAYSPSLIVLSPGPGQPQDYKMQRFIQKAIESEIPLFGVCLGMQGIAEYFGATLDELETPMHGQPSKISYCNKSPIFSNVEDSGLTVGRYHSLFVAENALPNCLKISAYSKEDNIIMALEHKEKPIMGVQFHPESIMSSENNTGTQLIRNVYNYLTKTHEPIS